MNISKRAAPRLRGEHVLVPVAKVSPNPWNPNVQSEEVYAKQRASIERFGFVAPIVVRAGAKKGTYEIIDGEHRLRVAQDLGLKEVPAWDLGKVDDAEARRLTEVFIHLHGEPDVVKESKLLRELADLSVGVDKEFPDLDGMLASFAEVVPFTSEQLKSIHDAIDFDWNQFGEPPGPSGPGEPDGPGTPGSLGLTFSGLSCEQLASVEEALSVAGAKGGAGRAEALVAISRFYLAAKAGADAEGDDEE
jgi:hypothetical protein